LAKARVVAATPALAFLAQALAIVAMVVSFSSPHFLLE
jgi:hypothetical protein